MRFALQNLPDAVWSRMKQWAKAQALVESSPTYDQCLAYLRGVVEELTGSRNGLRPDVLDFYAAEALEIVAKFRQDGRAGTDPDVETAV